MIVAAAYSCTGGGGGDTGGNMCTAVHCTVQLYTLCHPPPAMSTGWMEMFNYTPHNDEQLNKLAIILK